MELWQFDVVGGIYLTDGSELTCLTGVDDHSRFCVSAGLMHRANSKSVCDHLLAALKKHGIPQEMLTDNGKVFTGRFGYKDTEVLFDKICRENGIEHLLTAPRSPTTTGKIERFHRTLRTEFLMEQQFENFDQAQSEFNHFVDRYNDQRPHQSLDMKTPATSLQSGGTHGQQASLWGGTHLGTELGDQAGIC
jgi:transposase InsO family protein